MTAQIEPVQEKYLYFHNKPLQYIAISKRYRKSMDVLPNALSTIIPEKKLMKNKNSILFHKTKSSDYLCTTSIQSISSILEFFFSFSIWSYYVKTMPCSDSHLGFRIEQKSHIW